MRIREAFLFESKPTMFPSLPHSPKSKSITGRHANQLSITKSIAVDRLASGISSE